MRASTQNKIAATSIAAVGAGAAMMFFLDPDRGKTRRAFVHNKATRLARESGRFFAKASRDLEHRALGVMAETRSRISHDAASDDAVLVERVRSKMGRAVSYPGAIDVLANNGRVTLRGDVLQSEAGELLSCVGAVRGVVDVRNHLKTHANGDGVPGLQGHNDSGLERPGIVAGLKNPGTQILLGAATAGLLTFLGAKKLGTASRRGLFSR